jgi:hypothetical protein
LGPGNKPARASGAAAESGAGQAVSHEPNKHDRNDADAICEAVRRPGMRYVEVKSVAQQDLLALHRCANF